MNVVFMGQKQAWCIGLLTVMALGHTVEVVVAYDDMLRELALKLHLPVATTIKACSLEGKKLLVSVHGDEIVPPELLRLPYWGGINVHPFPIKGMRVIERLIEQGGETVYLRAHRMEERVDSGQTLAERVIDIKGIKTPVEVYNKLYPSYAEVLIEGIEANESYLAETEMGEMFWDKYDEDIRRMKEGDETR